MAEQKNPFEPYELQFSVSERKEMAAEMLRELRKSKGYQQKQVAEWLQISPQTYNGYEKGRNEPPIEILVRLSYLYNLPIDILVQKNRMHKMDESAMLTVQKMDTEIAEMKQDFEKSPYAENPQLRELMGMMGKMTDIMKAAVDQANKEKKYRE